MSGQPLRLVLPWPPSVNALWRSVRGRNILSKRGREYREEGLRQLGTQRYAPFPGAARLAVTLTLHPPDERRRDIDNAVKGPLDLMTAAGVWADDSQIDRLVVIRAGTCGGGLALVEITRLPDPPAKPSKLKPKESAALTDQLAADWLRPKETA